MTTKIVADSSANIYALSSVPFAAVPMHVCTAPKEYVDTPDCSVETMVSELKAYKGKSSTACPGVGEWLAAFEGAHTIYAVTITSGLSGSYAAALAAADQYKEEHPDAEILVIDSLSAGPELALLIEKLEEWIGQNRSFEEISKNMARYQTKTHLLFCLASVTNFARNGRVSPALAKLIGVLGIRMVGKASDRGTLELLHKCRGEKTSLPKLLEGMKEQGYAGGKVRIAHCFNPNAADRLKESIVKEFPGADVKITPCGALCSFYAEEGGILLGYEA